MHLNDSLNPRQLEAVHHDQGPLLILAGPGSGKTRVLTQRIAHLVLQKGADPQSVLAITFTNKAAQEMRSRVERLVGSVSREMWIGTFHATCARILRRHIDRLGFERNFVIYDNADQLRVIRSCLKACRVAEKAVRPPVILALLDRAKNQAVDPLELATESIRDPEVLRTLICAYAQSMKAANALDFGDLIVFVLHLFQRHPDILDAYRTRFPSILVDEYQDTNRAQHALLKALVPPAGGLCVVGDDDQAIYRWRGADVENMLSFATDFPGSRTITLEQNYRSTGNILQAAQAVARENPRRLEKQLWTANAPGDPLVSFEGDNQEAEAAYVADQIRSLVDRGTASFRDVGVFYRTNAQSRSLEERFLLVGIPYRVVGALRFYERAEVKDLMAYLRVVYNPRDSVSALRVLNRPPRGIGPVTQERLEAQAAETGRSVWDVLEEGVATGPWKGVARKNVEAFRETVLSLTRALQAGSGPADLLKRVLETTRYDDFLNTLPDADRRRENVDELIHTAADFQRAAAANSRECLGAFCERVALVTGADSTDGRADGVTLMTLHCAKGLEFGVVFLTGMEDGLLPHQRAALSEDGVSEERRLCYVGMTRAKQKLYLCRARTRQVYGNRRLSPPSPFLHAIPPELVRPAPDEQGAHPPADPDPRGFHGPELGPGGATASPTFPTFAPPTPIRALPAYRIGDRILHESLGEGRVLKVEPSAGRDKIVVLFSNGRIRKLLAQSAPIEKIPS